MSLSEIAAVLPTAAEVIARDAERGFHHGGQLYVSRRGEAIIDAPFGRLEDGREYPADALVNWLSAGKPLTAVAIMQLVERGQLDLDQRVAEFIPEFAQGGKEPITIRHLLMHTGGFRSSETGYPQASWDEIIATICAMPREDDWDVGETAGYHAVTSWFMLGEVIRRIDGRPIADYLADEVLAPIGMTDSRLTMTPEYWRENRGRITPAYRRLGAKQKQLDWHEQQRCTSPSPGSSMRGPLRDLGTFYEAMLATLSGQREDFLSTRGAKTMTARLRDGTYDRTFMHVVDFGLCFMVDSNRHGAETIAYGYGRHSSARAFGHGGAQSAIGFADPEYDLVVTWAFDTLIGEPKHNRRNRELNSAIYEDLGLTS
ncbi:serine hydrolase domain-containing protein [Stratiformator vulcanicus]|uniref:Penicillin-binding protein PbpX n=1 Tax=Stratiformator vulcanicus TaxID=2527980 RepID=A0A517R5Y9_9PLAN|nr:serine hydrolase domain-containing protein [Stratiformator vulcanicus]QDT39316.1 Putative penicillin-binding protein PbpX [Stratiformator vulcanicus]